MLLLEGHDGQDGFVQPYLSYEPDDYEETGDALYGASEFKRSRPTVDRLSDPDSFEWNPQMVADRLEDSCGWW
ncbi:uncharacterized protein ARMOST_16827 [Armillaria ostoyae]|uniref:Uncharacterized protein n=1 Tax=Armillaria ostoyae TaxID=47428 RepID=A0A284RXB8_ARMOS|nr:uncharacterized protein ARMOST_16827 [Armillaria ostoyae]